VAERLGAPFVSLLQRFDAELKTRKREELFVSNGHCTDAGYEIVAELVSQVVDPLLPK
jgi:lysophospholipase L1-like esterase